MDGSEQHVDARWAFDTLSRLVLDEQQSMEQLLQQVADLAQAALPGADGVSVTLLTEHGARTAVATGPAALGLDQFQYAQGEGPCLQAARTGKLVSIPEMATETGWADFPAAAAGLGWGSSLSVPIPMQQRGGAAVNIYSRAARAFDVESQQLGTTFASYAGVAMANMHLYDATRRLATDLETAMESRAVIEQAKGVLMRDRSCTEEEAFDLLVSASQRANRKLRDVAQALVDSTSA